MAKNTGGNTTPKTAAEHNDARRAAKARRNHRGSNNLAPVVDLFTELRMERMGVNTEPKTKVVVPRCVEKERLQEQMEEALLHTDFRGLPVNSDEFLAVVTFFAELHNIKRRPGWFNDAEAMAKARLKFSSMTKVRKLKTQWGFNRARSALTRVFNTKKAVEVTPAPVAPRDDELVADLVSVAVEAFNGLELVSA